MAQLRVTVLGPPRVWHGDAPVTFPTRKALALLVYLAVEGGLHSRETLAALLWPESAQRHSRGMLRYTLAALRRALRDGSGSAHLVVEREALGLDRGADFELDLDALPAGQLPGRPEAIAELRRAAERCRGAFLEGFSLPDAQGFEEWASVQRDSCQRRMQLVFDRLSQLESDRGEVADALDSVQRWLAIDPLNEEGYRRLMRLHLAVGDRSAALRAYQACRALLDRELRVAPAPETESLAERVRAGGAPAA